MQSEFGVCTTQFQMPAPIEQRRVACSGVILCRERERARPLSPFPFFPNTSSQGSTTLLPQLNRATYELVPFRHAYIIPKDRAHLDD